MIRPHWKNVGGRRLSRVEGASFPVLGWLGTATGRRVRSFRFVGLPQVDASPLRAFSLSPYFVPGERVLWQ